MNDRVILKNLDKTRNYSPVITLNDDEPVVIFSDLHMGNGSSRDDFLHNSGLFEYILNNYYLSNQSRLVLNGDVEELYKFRLGSITKKWHNLYSIFHEFSQKDRFYKIIGNHDYELQFARRRGINRNLLQGLRLHSSGGEIFIYHGHQTSNYMDTYNRLSLYLVRYLVHPLRIRNLTFTLNSRKIFRTERLSYEFSARNRIISIIGHTHKPLFESFSKRDTLTYNIERLLRKYPKVNKEKKKRKIEKNIREFSEELKNLREKNIINLRDEVYHDGLLVPSLFNTGAAIGKRGLTGIEIAGGKISLVYWFDRHRSERYINYKGIDTYQLPGTDYFKAILKSENLDYIFARINLMA
ncbi:MAG: metallophosphoesterase [Candidatus Kapaibacterium sp.]